MSQPLCVEELEGQSYPTPPQGVPIHRGGQAGAGELGCIADVWGGTGGHGASLPPKRLKQDRRDSGVSTAVWVKAASAIVPDPSNGASLSIGRPMQGRRDSGIFAVMWGGDGSSIVHGTPTGLPYPPNGPGRTAGTRVSLPLCGEERAVQWYPTPHGASISTERPMHNRGDSGVYATVWGAAESAIVRGTPQRGVPIPQTAQAGREGLGCICRCVGRTWRFNHTRPCIPSLSPN